MRFSNLSALLVALTFSNAAMAQWPPQETPWWAKDTVVEPNWWLNPPPKLPPRPGEKTADGWEVVTPGDNACPGKYIVYCIEQYRLVREKNAADWVNYYGTLIQDRFEEAISRAGKADDSKAAAELILEKRKYPPEPNRVAGRMRDDAERKYTDAVKSWEGANVMELIKQWGPPTSEYKAPDGSVMLTYNTSNVIDGTQYACALRQQPSSSQPHERRLNVQPVHRVDVLDDRPNDAPTQLHQ